MNARLMIGVGAVVLAAAGGGGWFLFGRDTGPTPEEVAAAKQATARMLWQRKEEMHRLSVFSYVYPAAGGSDRYSIPVMLQLEVKGRDGVNAICNSMPRLKEAVLRVFGASQMTIRPRSRASELARYATPLMHAINGQIPGNPVKRVDASLLFDAGVGGAAARRTDDRCRPYLNS